MKDFDRWNKLKINLNNQNRKFYVKPREIVWLSLGKNIGDEENGKGNLFLRPILVIKVFNSNIFYGVPLSSKIKDDNKYYLKVKTSYKKKEIFIIEEKSVLLSHARLFDTKRVVEHYGFMNKDNFIKTKSTLSALLFSESDYSDPRPKPICTTNISNPQNKSSQIIHHFIDSIKEEPLSTKYKYLICPVGLVGAGKTTVVRPIANALNIPRINSDEIRRKLKLENSGYGDLEKIYLEVGQYFLKNDYGLVIDADCSTKIDLINEIAIKHNLKIIWIHLNTNEDFVINKLKNYKGEQFLTNNQEDMVANYYERKKLHQKLNLEIKYDFIIDASVSDLDDKIQEIINKLK